MLLLASCGQGVTCDNTHSRANSLNLWAPCSNCVRNSSLIVDPKIDGSNFVASLSGLTALTQLSFVNLQIRFRFSIPPAITIANLVSLSLSGCQFSGPSIPAEVGNIVKLTDLRSMATSFLVAFLTPLAISRTSTACILKTIKWSQLDHEDHPVEELGLPSPRLQQDIWSHSQVVGRHNLDRGAKWWTRLNLQPIPAAIGNCTQLKILDVRHNKLSGPLPHELGKLKNLQKLFAGNHQLKTPSQRNSAASLLARDRHQPQQNNWPDSFNLRWDFLSQFGWLRLHQQHAHRYWELWTHVYTSPNLFCQISLYDFDVE